MSKITQLSARTCQREQQLL